MSEGRRLSPAWLAAAFGLFALDIALHLPITDFFDSLAKRFGFFEYDAATAWVFLALGVGHAGRALVVPAAQAPRGADPA